MRGAAAKIGVTSTVFFNLDPLKIKGSQNNEIWERGKGSQVKAKLKVSGESNQMPITPMKSQSSASEYHIGNSNRFL